VYAVQVLHLAGSGLLSNVITSVVGGSNKVTWIVNPIPIAAGVLGPPFSQAADYWGRKWIVVIPTVCGFVGCLIASRADTFGQLIAGQSIAAITAGAQPLLHAIASEITPRKYRSLAQSAVNVAAALGAIIGLLAGGALTRTHASGFRTFFYITAGLYAVCSVIIMFLYNPPLRDLQTKLTQREKLSRLDWIGYALFFPGLVLFSFALTSSTNVYPWKSAKIIGPLIVGAVLLIAFFLYEWKGTRTGMLHHDLFSWGRNFALAELIMLTEGIVFFCATQYYGFEVSVLFDKDLFHAGLYYTVGWWTMVVATTVCGIYCSWTKTIRPALTTAFVAFAIFSATMASLDPSKRASAIGFTPFFGIGLGTALNTLVTVAQLSTPPELISLTTGLMIGTRSVGGTIALAIYSAIFSGTLNDKIPSKVSHAVLPLGLDPQYLGELLEGLTTENSTLLGEIPGITPTIIEAAGSAVKQAYTLAFRYCWVTAAAFAGAAVIGKII
jgi:MFS family permease